MPCNAFVQENKALEYVSNKAAIFMFSSTLPKFTPVLLPGLCVIIEFV